MLLAAGSAHGPGFGFAAGGAAPAGGVAVPRLLHAATMMIARHAQRLTPAL
jgi:hypothetical protein